MRLIISSANCFKYDHWGCEMLGWSQPLKPLYKPCMGATGGGRKIKKIHGEALLVSVSVLLLLSVETFSLKFHYFSSIFCDYKLLLKPS